MPIKTLFTLKLATLIILIKVWVAEAISKSNPKLMLSKQQFYRINTANKSLASDSLKQNPNSTTSKTFSLKPT